MCLGVFFLGSNFFGTRWASRTSWKSVSFARLGKFYFINISNKFSISCSSSSPSGTPMIRMLGCLKTSWKFLSLSSFFLNSCFFILFWLTVYFFPLVQTVDLSPGFLPFTVGSLCVFLYFTCHCQLISQKRPYRHEGAGKKYSKSWKARTYIQDYCIQQSYHLEWKGR